MTPNSVNPAYWPIIGHDWAIDQLQRALAHQRQHHAYLITGPAAIGKTTLALNLAMALNCTNPNRPCGECRSCTLIMRKSHPDVSLTQAEQVGAILKIDQIRELQRNLALRPYEARHKIAILRRFHEANPATQNALLKTLEEPPQSVVLILTSEHMDLLLPTIISRCQVLNLRPLSLQNTEDALLTQYPDIDPAHLSLVAHLSSGRLGWAFKALENEDDLAFRGKAIELLEAILSTNKRSERFQHAESLSREKGDLAAILEHWLSYWRDILLMGSGSQVPIANIDRLDTLQAIVQRISLEQAQAALKATQRSMSYLARNVNTRLILEVLTLDYPFF